MEKKSVANVYIEKQNKNEIKTNQYFIRKITKQKSVCKYLTLARASKINTYTKIYYQTAGQIQRSKLKIITAFLARYHSSKVFPSLMKWDYLTRIKYPQHLHTLINNYNKRKERKASETLRCSSRHFSTHSVMPKEGMKLGEKKSFL